MTKTAKFSIFFCIFFKFLVDLGAYNVENIEKGNKFVVQEAFSKKKYNFSMKKCLKFGLKFKVFLNRFLTILWNFRPSFDKLASLEFLKRLAKKEFVAREACVKK